MNKAILVIGMPKSCEDCRFYADGKCYAKLEEDRRENWCPLRPFQLGEELRKFRKTIKDKKTLIGFNMAVAICNKHLGGDE